MDRPPQYDTPIKIRPKSLSRWLRLSFVLFGIAVSLGFCFLARPEIAHAAWLGFAKMIPFRSTRSGLDALPIPEENLALLGSQQQAEVLLEAAINHSDPATAQIMWRVESWRGHLTATPRLLGLLNTALNSGDLKVRAAAIESELAVGNLPKDPAAPNALIKRIRRQPAARPWALWMLGALGNRGVEPDRTFAILVKYTHDREEKSRYWAVEGLALFGSDESIGPLLQVLRSDASPEVRERAASGLAQSGMLTKEQRMKAVPALIDYAGDSSLDANTHVLAYRALHDITGAAVADNPSAWRDYWSAASSH